MQLKNGYFPTEKWMFDEVHSISDQSIQATQILSSVFARVVCNKLLSILYLNGVFRLISMIGNWQSKCSVQCMLMAAYVLLFVSVVSFCTQLHETRVVVHQYVLYACYFSILLVLARLLFCDKKLC